MGKSLQYFLIALTISLANGQDSYDFIVVGGGTTGCIVAGRLSENGRHSVLLLEAGGTPTEDMDIPVKAPTYQVDPAVTFQYKSVPQVNASLGHGGIINIPLGRVLGGTGSINYMFFNRGHPKDYDNWASITTDPSWRYDNLLPFFKKMEDYQGSYPSDQHGTGGPLTVTNQTYAPGLAQWLGAGRELGYEIADPNGPEKISFTPVEYNKKMGRRVSTYTAYIKPFQNSRPNLKVVTDAYVNKIILEGTKATQVRYLSGPGQTETIVRANKEIIISAGAYGSAVLLQKSGIGPRDVLTAAGIPVIKELPVGHNLQDHPIAPIEIVVGNDSLVFKPARDLTPENLDLYTRTGEGPYATTAGLFGQAFVASSVAVEEGEGDWADIQFSMYAQEFTSLLPNTTLGELETLIFSYPYLGRQKSRGTVKVDPTNIENQPIIDFRFFEDPRDIRIMVDAMKMTMKIVEETLPYRLVGGRYPPNSLEACMHLHFRSDTYWECYVKQMLVGGNHPVGTARMGRGAEDPEAVVDSKMKVIGIEALRVIDASIMPVINNANVQVGIFVIGEKGANDILQDWN